MNKKHYKTFLTLGILGLALSIGIHESNSLSGFFSSGFGGGRMSRNYYYVGPAQEGTGNIGRKISNPGDMQATLATVRDGDTIVMLTGTYNPSTTYLIEDSITIKQFNTVEIDCSNSRNCFELDKAGKKADVSGISLSNFSRGFQITNGELIADQITFENPLTADSRGVYADKNTIATLTNSSFINDKAVKNPEMMTILAALNGSKVTVDSVEAINLGWGIYSRYPRKISVSNSYFSGNYYGIENWGSYKASFTNNTIEENTDGVFLIGTGNTDFTGNHIKNANYCLGVHASASLSGTMYNSNLNAEENVIEDCKYGIYTETDQFNGSSNEYFHNEIFDSEYGIVSYNGVTDIYNKNHIHNNDTGIKLPFNAWTTTPNNESLFTNNLIENTNLFALDIDNSSAEFMHNTFTGGVNGITTDSSDQSQLTNNIIQNFSKDGFTGNSSNTQLSHNIFYNNGTDTTGSFNDLGGMLYTDPILKSDYSPELSSPAVNTGIYSIPISTDFLDNPRNRNYDIGAFEYHP